MRKLDKKNKISFNIFGLLVVISLTFIVYTAYKVLNADREVYTIGRESVVYDDKSKSIDMASVGHVEKKWNGNYYLTLENDEKYDLGQHNVFYDTNENRVSILGDGYQVFTDGSVKKIVGRTDLEDANEVKFYKLADRKYLLSGLHIQSKEEGFDTSNYVYIQMDKSGNALLLNHEVNMKTVNPMVLVSGEVEFDIANEILSYKEDKVNLKAINGSTNEYKPIVEDKQEDEESSIVEENSTENQNEQVFDAPSSNVQNQGNNQSGNHNSGTSNENVNKPDEEENNSSSPQVPTLPTTPGDDKVYDRSIALRSVKAGVDELAVDYYISDVENKFIDVHLLVLDELEQEVGRFQLNKSLTNVVIRNLKPNEKYTLSLNYSMYYTEKGVTKKIDYTADTTSIRTKVLNAKIEVDKIFDSSLTYHVYMDDEYVLDSADIYVYFDALDTEREPDVIVPVDIDKAVDSEGYQDTLEIIESTEKFQFVLKNAVYNGQQIDLNVQCSVYHERNMSIADFFINLFK